MVFLKKFFCPVNGYNCPYWKEDYSCALVDADRDPVSECDDAAAFWDADDDYFVWEGDDGATYDAEGLIELGYHFVDGEPVAE